MDIKTMQWPALDFKESESTFALLHQWTQIVGKVRLALSPKKKSLLACDTLSLL